MSCVTPDISPSTRSASRRERTLGSRCGRLAGATAGNGANGLHGTIPISDGKGHWHAVLASEARCSIGFASTPSALRAPDSPDLASAPAQGDRGG